MGEPLTRHHRKNPGIPLRSSTRITGGDLIGTLLRRLILNNGHRRLIVDRPARTVRRAFAGLALLSSLVACGTTSAKPSPLGTPQSSTNAVTTPTPVASQGTTTTTGLSNLIPADAQMPAGGICGRAVGPLAVIIANPDTHSPRCMIVTGSQHLKVTNGSHQFGQTGRTITVSFASFPPRQIAVGASTTFDRDFGSYLAPGVHVLHISLYGGDGADIWLR